MSSTIVRDARGVHRFRGNRIVKDLVEAAAHGDKLDLNRITVRVGDRYTRDEVQELYRLMGYSVDGFLDALAGTFDE